MTRIAMMTALALGLLASEARGDGMVYPIEAGWPACMSREAYGQLMEAFREGGTARAVSVGGCGQTRSGTVRVIEWPDIYGIAEVEMQGVRLFVNGDAIQENRGTFRVY
jgi:hypothetical protein